MTISHAKMAKPIEVPLGVWTHGFPKNYLLDGGRDPNTGMGTLEGDILGHAWTWLAVDSQEGSTVMPPAHHH